MHITFILMGVKATISDQLKIRVVKKRLKKNIQREIIYLRSDPQYNMANESLMFIYASGINTF